MFYKTLNVHYKLSQRGTLWHIIIIRTHNIKRNLSLKRGYVVEINFGNNCLERKKLVKFD